MSSDPAGAENDNQVRLAEFLMGWMRCLTKINTKANHDTDLITTFTVL
jgi:hypothetical protein